MDRGAGAGAGAPAVQFHAEEGAEVLAGEGRIGCHGRLAGNRASGGGGRRSHQLAHLDPAQHEQQLRLVVQAGAHAVEHRGEMFAHACPIRAGAVHCDLRGCREQAGVPAGHIGKDLLRKPALEQVHQIGHLPGAALLEGLPPVGLHGLELDPDPVEGAS
ncbi:MAG: hypothetical protein ACK55I_15805, partial [bacterium]